MSKSIETNLLTFDPFRSAVENAFWSKMTDLKLNEYKIDETPRDITGYYSNANPHISVPPLMNLDFQSFDSVIGSNRSSSLQKCCSGKLILFNTLQSFNKIDKNELLMKYGLEVFDAIKSGACLKNPSLLMKLILLCYADIKKYRYYYWFAFPAVDYLQDLTVTEKPEYLSEVYNEDTVNDLQSQLLKNPTDFFLVQEADNRKLQLVEFSHLDALKGKDLSKIMIGFHDPSSNPKSPGWPLRNLLLAWAYLTESTEAKVICWRSKSEQGQLTSDYSILFKVVYKFDPLFNVAKFRFYGWERNEDNALAPRFLDLSKLLDPTRLCEKAVSLNLQLMRWRLVPNLDLEKLSQTSCLLFGAGTLGCNVARCLLGWGVHKITFVDNGKVSYSNPVRQTLFKFQDCLNGGKNKCEAAAEAIKAIYPSAEVASRCLSIPMPGHTISVSEEEKAKETILEIEELVKKHDVLFLLLDSREARWLPSAFGALHKKLTISTALGFDSYLVMRHGYGSFDDAQNWGKSVKPKFLPGSALGCYYCSDVTAPANSLLDRTLDQQCTVTRPGMSFIASGLAVELMVSVLQHPLGANAPVVCNFTTKNENADSQNGDLMIEQEDDYSSETCLGSVPHQIRGFAHSFAQMTPCVQRFAHCVCCGVAVLETLAKNERTEKFDFLKKVCNEPRTLETLSGLDLLLAQANDDVIALSDNDSLGGSDNADIV